MCICVYIIKIMLYNIKYIVLLHHMYIYIKLYVIILDYFMLYYI